MPLAQNVPLTPQASATTPLPTVCIVTLDEEFLNVLRTELLPWVQVVVRDTYEDLARWTRERQVSAVLLDIDTQGEDPYGGLPVLAELRRLNKDFTLISMSRARARSVEKQALSAGVDAHFRSPVDVPELRMTLLDTIRRRGEDAERERSRHQALEASRFQDFIGASEPMRLVYDAIQQIAASNINVLIQGESGTGKELAARAIVALGRRANKPFIRLNCAALPENLIESELFGSERGAFTGATESRPGHIELADGGTLFLDEVAELPAETQIMLLRVLQEREFERVGGSAPVRVNVRVIVATNRDLHAAVADGTFRADLFYRLNVFPLDVPPLRARRSDVPLLVEYFTHRSATRLGKRIRRLSTATSTLLQAYDWPGNIRELQNVIERAVIVCESDTLAIDPRWLTGRSLGTASVASLSTGTLATHEKDAIEAALTDSKGRVAGPFGAAGRLGVPASTLESKIKALQIDKRRFKAG